MKHILDIEFKMQLVGDCVMQSTNLVNKILRIKSSSAFYSADNYRRADYAINQPYFNN